MPRFTYWPGLSMLATCIAIRSGERPTLSTPRGTARGGHDGAISPAQHAFVQRRVVQDDAVDEDAGNLHVFGRDRADRDDLVDLGNRDTCSRRPSAGWKFQVEPIPVRLPSSSAFSARTKPKSGLSAVSRMYSLPSIVRRSLPSATTVCTPTGREEGRDAGSARAQTLGEDALRRRLELDLAARDIWSSLAVGPPIDASRQTRR